MAKQQLILGTEMRYEDGKSSPVSINEINKKIGIFNGKTEVYKYLLSLGHHDGHIKENKSSMFSHTSWIVNIYSDKTHKIIKRNIYYSKATK